VIEALLIPLRADAAERQARRGGHRSVSDRGWLAGGAS
jgi:hypothetical protein